MHLLSRFVVAVGFMGMPIAATACDICGCANGNASFGLLPLTQRHFVGFRWQLQGFNTRSHGSAPNSVERFHTLDLWGRWQLHRRVQIIGTVPFLYNSRHFDDGTSHNVQGMGDASVLAQVALLDPNKQRSKKWQHTAQFGMGIKLPTGKIHGAQSSEEILAPAIQPSTGSTDFLFSALYALRRGSWGVSADALAQWMGQNGEGYQFGHRVAAGTRIFWAKNRGKISFLPYLGASLDARNRDSDQGSSIAESGGRAFFGHVGFEFFRGNMAFGMGSQLPLFSNLAQGHVTPLPRFSAACTYLFGSKIKKIQLDASKFQSSPK